MSETLSIDFFGILHASANGRFAIVALSVLVIALLALRLLGGGGVDAEFPGSASICPWCVLHQRRGADSQDITEYFNAAINVLIARSSGNQSRQTWVKGSNWGAAPRAVLAPAAIA
jgi:hypothetical protein